MAGKDVPAILSSVSRSVALLLDSCATIGCPAAVALNLGSRPVPGSLATSLPTALDRLVHSQATVSSRDGDQAALRVTVPVNDDVRSQTHIEYWYRRQAGGMDLQDVVLLDATTM